MVRQNCYRSLTALHAKLTASNSKLFLHVVTTKPLLQQCGEFHHAGRITSTGLTIKCQDHRQGPHQNHIRSQNPAHRGFSQVCLGRLRLRPRCASPSHKAVPHYYELLPPVTQTQICTASSDMKFATGACDQHSHSEDTDIPLGKVSSACHPEQLDQVWHAAWVPLL